MVQTPLRYRLSRLPCVRRALELWCAWMAMLPGSCLRGEARSADATVSSGAWTCGACALPPAVGALRDGAFADRAGAAPALLRVAVTGVA